MVFLLYLVYRVKKERIMMYNATYRERPQRTNKPVQPKNGENKMDLKECITCGSHSFTNGKCDYCRNKYDSVNENEIFYGNLKEDESSEEVIELDFKDTKAGKLILKIMLIILASIIWFAVTVFIPPLFIITIILLVVYGSYRLTIKNK